MKKHEGQHMKRTEGVKLERARRKDRLMRGEGGLHHCFCERVKGEEGREGENWDWKKGDAGVIK